jgi:hypothetical protein
MKTKDHVVPKSKGGWKTVLACLSCNGKKAAKTIEEFRTICGGVEFWGEKIARRENEKTAILEDETLPTESVHFVWRWADITGKRFGRFTVIRHLDGEGVASSRWLVRCDCGNEEIRRVRSIVNPANDIDMCVDCRRPLGKYRSDYWHDTGIELSPKEVFSVFYPSA